MREHSLDRYNDAIERISCVIGNLDGPTLNTTENVSRDRLLRVQKGLLHLLTDVIPTIEDEQQRAEIYYWVEGIHTITQCEECDSKREVNHA